MNKGVLPCENKKPQLWQMIFCGQIGPCGGFKTFHRYYTSKNLPYRTLPFYATFLDCAYICGATAPVLLIASIEAGIILAGGSNGDAVRELPWS